MRFDNTIWHKELLSENTVFLKGNGYSKCDITNDGFPCILYGQLYTTYLSEIINEVYSKTPNIIKNIVYSKSNDVIIPASGETPEDIATACCVINTGIILGGDLNILRLSNHNGAFLSYQLNCKRKYDIARLAVGKSIVHLHNDDLKKLVVYYPMSKEYEDKVVSLLTNIDNRIITQKKIIEDLYALKKEINNKYFSKISGCNIMLKDLYIKAKSGGTPRSTIKEYYNGEIPFLSISDITGSGKYINHCEKSITKLGLKNSSAWLVPKNSLILSMYASVGIPCINNIDLATSQAMYSMIIKEKYDIDYLYEYLIYFKNNKLKSMLETGTQSNINASIVDNIMIPFYSKEADYCFTNLMLKYDERIENEKKILLAYEKQKQYLLNHMFI